MVAGLWRGLWPEGTICWRNEAIGEGFLEEGPGAVKGTVCAKAGGGSQGRPLRGAVKTVVGAGPDARAGGRLVAGSWIWPGRVERRRELGSGVQLGAGARGPRHLSSILDGPAADVC